MDKMDVIKHINDFYNSHKDECDFKYLEAIEKERMNYYKEVKDEKIINNLFLKTSIVIITANTYEKNLLHSNTVKEKKQKIAHCTMDICENPKKDLIINMYFFDIGRYRILHMEAKQTGSYSIGGSADLIRFIMRNNLCYPSAVISFGICFGVDCTKQQLGDTIIAKKIYPYFISTKIREDEIYIDDTNIFEIDNELESKMKHFKDTGQLKGIKNIFIGNMITGECVISNESIKSILIKAATNQPILGGDMEGYGLFKECQNFECSMPCLIIKSICDWGAYKNIEGDNINLKDRLQAYAADRSYKVLSLLLNSRYSLFEMSIYEQICKRLFQKDLKIGQVVHKPLIESLLAYVKTPKKYDTDFICDIVLKELFREGKLKLAKDDIYEFKNTGEKI